MTLTGGHEVSWILYERCILLFTLGGILCLSSMSSKDGKLHSRVLETTPSAIRFPPVGYVVAKAKQWACLTAAPPFLQVAHY